MNSNMRKMYTEQEIIDLVKSQLKNKTVLVRGSFDDDTNARTLLIYQEIFSRPEDDEYTIRALEYTENSMYNYNIDFENATINDGNADIEYSSANIELIDVLTGNVITHF